MSLEHELTIDHAVARLELAISERRLVKSEWHTSRCSPPVRHCLFGSFDPQIDNLNDLPDFAGPYWYCQVVMELWDAAPESSMYDLAERYRQTMIPASRLIGPHWDAIRFAFIWTLLELAGRWANAPGRTLSHSMRINALASVLRQRLEHRRGRTTFAVQEISDSVDGLIEELLCAGTEVDNPALHYTYLLRDTCRYLAGQQFISVFDLIKTFVRVAAAWLAQDGHAEEHKRRFALSALQYSLMRHLLDLVERTASGDYRIHFVPEHKI